MKTISAVLFLAISYSLQACAVNSGKGAGMSSMTLERAIAIGENELKEQNYFPYDEKLFSEADAENSSWNAYVGDSPEILEGELKRALEGKEYWAIYYIPEKLKDKEGVKGGDAHVFIERSTGKVLYLFGGK